MKKLTFIVAALILFFAINLRNASAQICDYPNNTTIGGTALSADGNAPVANLDLELYDGTTQELFTTVKTNSQGEFLIYGRENCTFVGCSITPLQTCKAYLIRPLPSAGYGYFTFTNTRGGLVSTGESAAAFGIVRLFAKP